jgi:hypothetical protein
MLTQERLKSILSYEEETGIFRWRIEASTRARTGSVAGTVDCDGYTVIRIAGKGYKAHRLAWLYVHGVFPEKVIDHINEQKRDNSIRNLRLVTTSENNQNITPPNLFSTSGLRGVSWFEQYGKWKGTFQVMGKKIFVGYFDDKHDAYRAVQLERLKRQYHDRAPRHYTIADTQVISACPKDHRP